MGAKAVVLAKTEREMGVGLAGNHRGRRGLEDPGVAVG
jgi:hypothetical protein